ncbi:MAG TPA: hypothetical protein VF618_14545 [Thermoanaerobaculia bacterium]
MRIFSWVLAAALSAYACHLSVQHATPIDAALPFLAVILTVVAWASTPTVMLAVPLLIGGEMLFGDERVRLLWFGAVVAGALVYAFAANGTDETDGKSAEAAGPYRALYVAGAAILLLRWIPFPVESWIREGFLLAFCLAIVALLRSTPFALFVGVATALFTPAVPLRTLFFPMLILMLAAFVRRALPRLTVPALALVAVMVLFFPWSGIVARATPYFFRNARPATERHHINQALAASKELTIEVPERATALIVSGANVPRMVRGTVLGVLQCGPSHPSHSSYSSHRSPADCQPRPIVIGDASDWGYLRRENFYAARNPLPRDPAGRVRDYGYAAWIDGAGRVPLPRGARTIRVTADPRLPQGSSLQVEAFELER